LPQLADPIQRGLILHVPSYGNACIGGHQQEGVVPSYRSVSVHCFDNPIAERSIPNAQVHLGVLLKLLDVQVARSFCAFGLARVLPLLRECSVTLTVLGVVFSNSAISLG
jgi:hypothetical protein